MVPIFVSWLEDIMVKIVFPTVLSILNILAIYDCGWWPVGASDAIAIYFQTIAAFIWGNTFSLLQKKYTKIYIFT